MKPAHLGPIPPRRALAGVAVLALTGAVLGPISASADDGRIAPGSPAPESKIQDNQAMGAEVAPNAYFVQFTAPTTSEGGSLQAIQAERDQFMADARTAGVEVEVREEFASLWNGVSISADEQSLLELANSPVVDAIFPVGVIEVPTQPEPTTIEPDMFTAISMTGADIVQNELGLTGEGIRIGIIDTGVDYDHPDFGGNGEPGSTTFPTEKVAFGYDFVGDSYNASPSAGAAYQPNPMPDADPDDCNGHGTHVAGISAADGEVTGVAPAATVGAYRVFGCAGSTNADIMLHAMEMTLADEMDVVNLSIGSAFSSWKEYPTAQATDALAREGVVVVASIGNSGANGLHSAGAPGVGEDTIGVGSVDNTQYQANFVLDEEDNEVPYTIGTPAPEPPTEGSGTVVATAEPGSDEAQACGADPFSAEDKALIEGNWVMIQRGVCPFHEKARNGQAAGAAGVLLYNNTGGSINPALTGDPAITVPTIMVSQADGTRMAQWALDNGSTTVTFTDEETSVPNPTGGLMSSFSSFGTMADTTFKPDLSAPGGQIYAPYPLERQPYATLSGTSMASPHVAGAAALLLEAEPGLSVQDVKLRLQNTSTQLPLSISPAAGLEVVHRQGTGMIRIDDAVLADVLIEPGLVQLGQQLSGETTAQSVTIRNYTDEVQTFTTGHVPAAATSGTANAWGYYLAPAQVVVQDTVVVPAGGSVEVPMTITSPTIPGQMGPIFGGYVTFTGAESSYSVTYGGYAHDLQQVEVLADLIDADGEVVQELPALAVNTACAIPFGLTCADPNGTYTLVEDYTYSMDGLDVPTLLAHFEHQARSMEWVAWTADEAGQPAESLGTVARVDYTTRSASRNAVEAFTWDGRVVDENGARIRVADGDYVLQVIVTKASAWNDTRTAEQEEWISPSFGVAFSGSGLVDAPSIDRVITQDRWSTASELAVENFEPGVDTVYVASGENFPDALAGSALAGSQEVPVLLTKADAVPAATRMALQTLAPERIVVLGGRDVVVDDVLTALSEYAPVERLAGAHRYATAVAVAEQYPAGTDVAFVASGEVFPDAISAAAAAGVEGAPVLLAKSDLLPQATRDALEAMAPSVVYVIGGTEAISVDVAEALQEYAGQVVRLGGKDRYGTAQAVAGEFFPTPTAMAVLATGRDYPDALTAAPVAAMNNGPVLLTRPDLLSSAAWAALQELRVQSVLITGGYGAVSLEVQEDLAGRTYE